MLVGWPERSTRPMVELSGRSRRARPAMPDQAPSRPLRFLDAAPQVPTSGPELPVRVPIRGRQLAGARFISVCVSDVDVSSGAWHLLQPTAGAPTCHCNRLPQRLCPHAFALSCLGPWRCFDLAAIAGGSRPWRRRHASESLRCCTSRSQPLLGRAARSSLSAVLCSRSGRQHRS